jgi:hypothetical protein
MMRGAKQHRHQEDDPLKYFTRLAAIAALVLPSAAFADGLFNVTTSSCSGSLEASSSNGLSFACIGDFFLSGGSIESNESISLSASGALSISNVFFNAPSVTLTSGTALVLNGERAWLPVDGDTAVLGALGMNFREILVNHGSGSSIQLSAGGLTTTVPESSTFALMVGGLIAMGVAYRHRIKT